MDRALSALDRSIGRIVGATPPECAFRDWLTQYGRQHRIRLAGDVMMVQARAVPPATVVEFGSAPMFLTDALQTAGFVVQGLDIAPDRFSTVCDQFHMTVYQSDFEQERVPLADGVGDIVLFNEVFEHLRIDPIFTVSEAYRVLRPGGRLLLSTPNLRSLRGLWMLLVRHRGATASGGPYEEYSKLRELGHMGHVREYTSHEVAEFLEKIGFVIEGIVYRDPRPRPTTPGSSLVRFMQRFLFWFAPSWRPMFSIVARKRE